MNSSPMLFVFFYFFTVFSNSIPNLQSSETSSEVYISPFGSDSGAGTEADPFETLSAAISAVTAGGTVFVMTGTYTGSRNMFQLTKNVTIQGYPSTISPTTHVFDALGEYKNGQFFSFTTGISVTFKGVGFRNSNQYPNYGAVTVLNAFITLINCRFWQNKYALVVQGQTTTLQNVEFVDNQNSILFPYRDFGSNGITIVANNVSVVGGGSGLVVSTGPVTFRGNSLSFRNVGIALDLSSQQYNFDVRIANVNIMSCSRGVYAYGLPSGYSGRVVLENATISNNSLSSYDGAGIYVGSRIVFAINDGEIENNRAGGRGGGIYCGDQGAINLQTVVVSGNSASDGGAGWCSKNCAFLASDVQSSNNTGKTNSSPCPGL